MEKMRTDLTKWFLTIFLNAHDKRGIPTQRVSVEIFIAYKPAWLILHKIRRSMKEWDAEFSLVDIVELVDVLFDTLTEDGKRGRDIEEVKVLVGLSLNKLGHPLYLKM